MSAHYAAQASSSSGSISRIQAKVDRFGACLPRALRGIVFFVLMPFLLPDRPPQEVGPWTLSDSARCSSIPWSARGVRRGNAQSRGFWCHDFCSHTCRGGATVRTRICERGGIKSVVINMHIADRYSYSILIKASGVSFPPKPPHSHRMADLHSKNNSYGPKCSTRVLSIRSW